MHGFLVFAGVALVVTLTPGPATALIVRSAIRGGHRAALLTTAGNSMGILFWAGASAVGISALVAASEVAFVGLKIAGAVTLVVLGVQSWRRTLRGEAREVTAESSRSAFRNGVVTSFANPKLAVFFVALFPQFLSSSHSELPKALAMGALIVAYDVVYFSLIAFVVTRARAGFERGPWARRLERATGSVMIGLGLRLAVER